MENEAMENIYTASVLVHLRHPDVDISYRNYGTFYGHSLVVRVEPNIAFSEWVKVLQSVSDQKSKECIDRVLASAVEKTGIATGWEPAIDIAAAHIHDGVVIDSFPS